MQPTLNRLCKLMISGVLFAAMLGACTDAEQTGDVVQPTAGSGIVGAIVATGSLGQTEVEIKWGDHIATVEGPVTLYQQEITFQPGGHTGWHTHGGIALATIVQGTLTLFEGSNPCVGTTYPAGTAFVDPGHGHVHVARNLDPSATALVRVQYINPTGSAVRIDAPAPAGSELCP